MYLRETVDPETMALLIRALENWDRENYTEFHIFNDCLAKINKLGLNLFQKDQYYSTISVPKESVNAFIEVNKLSCDLATGEVKDDAGTVCGISI